MIAKVITYGARLQSMMVPDTHGKAADVVLGYPDIGGYLLDPAYLGATIGRWANRIAGATFPLSGKEFALASNDGPNLLHGGTRGFDSRLWTVEDHHAGESPTAVLSLVSPDGEEGFPGELRVTAIFTLDSEGRLTVDYEAVCDRATMVNLTHHSYWNLVGEASGRDAREQELTILADAFLPIRKGGIPTGEFRGVASTPVRFSRASPASGEWLRGRSAVAGCGWLRSLLECCWRGDGGTAPSGHPARSGFGAGRRSVVRPARPPVLWR